MASVYAFDAYGTLFDVHAAAARHKTAIGPSWERLSQLWRTKHLEYTWIYSQTRRKPTFWLLAQQSLDYAIASVGGIPDGLRDHLLAAYRRMDAFPEVREVLSALRAKGARLAILSNGDQDMVDEAVSAARLDGMLDAVLSVADAGIFKPDDKVYQLVLDRFGVARSDVSFQSSNRWDVAGAKAFGFCCVWINRGNMPDEYPDLAPDRTIADLRGLLD
ncbi:MAG: haloacid dehalogenase type II [Hyphomicrobiaceae bacterium]